VIQPGCIAFMMHAEGAAGTAEIALATDTNLIM